MRSPPPPPSTPPCQTQRTCPQGRVPCVQQLFHLPQPAPHNEHKKHAHKGVFFIFSFFSLPTNMQNMPSWACFVCSSSFLLTLTANLPTLSTPPPRNTKNASSGTHFSCSLPYSSHQMQKHAHMGTFSCLIPISFPKYVERALQGTFYLFCPFPSLEHVECALWGTFYLFCSLPSLEHVEHAYGGAFYMYSLLSTPLNIRKCPLGHLLGFQLLHLLPSSPFPISFFFIFLLFFYLI